MSLFDLSGSPDAAARVTLEAVQSAAVELGFVKRGAGDDKPLAQRADVQARAGCGSCDYSSLWGEKVVAMESCCCW